MTAAENDERLGLKNVESHNPQNNLTTSSFSIPRQDYMPSHSHLTPKDDHRGKLGHRRGRNGPKFSY